MKKQLFALLVSAAIFSANPAFGMLGEAEKVFLEQNTLEKENLEILISHAREGNIQAQDKLMRRQYFGIVSRNLLSFDRINFLSWKNIAERSAENDHIAYFIQSKGVETEKQFPNLFEKTKDRAKQNVPSAQSTLGSMYLSGWGVGGKSDKNDKKAFKYFKRSADQLYSYGLFNLALMYKEGRGVGGISDENDGEALKYFKLSAGQGLVCALNGIASIHEKGRVKGGVSDKNNKEACKYYKLAADQGDSSAQWSLGSMYREGRGVGGISDENDGEALKYFKLSADQGNSSSQYFLGGMYEAGRGVGGISDENDKEACKYYKLAADRGDSYAQNSLGRMYQKGRCEGGISNENKKEAFKYACLSAEQGNSYGQMTLGEMYQSGCGIQKNLIEALRWWIKSKSPYSKKSILSLLHPRLLEEEKPEGNKSPKDLFEEIFADLSPLTRTYQLKMEENNPEGFNAFFIPQLYEYYKKIEEVSGELVEKMQCLRPGCLMTGFSASEDLKSSFAQQLQPHFLAIDAIEGVQYITIGEKNVCDTKTLLTCLNRFSEIDEILKLVSTIYQDIFKSTLTVLLKRQIEVQQSTDPLVIEEFKQLTQTASLCEEESKRMEKERETLQNVNKKTHSYIRLSATQRNQEFLEDEMYSFLK